MEGGVEARYLGQMRESRLEHFDQRDLAGQVREVQTLRPPQFRQYRHRYQLMFPQVDTAVNNTVSNRLRWRVRFSSSQFTRISAAL